MLLFWRLKSVCLSRTSGLSREQRGLGRPKLAQRWPTSHVTRIPLPRSKGQRSRSPGRFTHRRVGASGGCSAGRGSVLVVGNCCYVAVCSAAEGASAPTGEERGGAYRGGRPPTACSLRGGYNYDSTSIRCPSTAVEVLIRYAVVTSH